MGCSSSSGVKSNNKHPLKQFVKKLANKYGEPSEDAADFKVGPWKQNVHTVAKDPICGSIAETHEEQKPGYEILRAFDPSKLPEIKEITVYWDYPKSMIHGFKIKYRRGGLTYKHKHPTGVNCTKKMLKLKYGEWITSVKGWVDGYVSRIEFETNLG